jgi:hypothetical protein
MLLLELLPTLELLLELEGELSSLMQRTEK